MVFALNGIVTLTFDLVTSKFIGVIYWPWPIFLPSTMTVTHKLFKILSGHDVASGRTDGQTDERHTIIRPKFYFGRIKTEGCDNWPGTIGIGMLPDFVRNLKVSLVTGVLSGAWKQHYISNVLEIKKQLLMNINKYNYLYILSPNSSTYISVLPVWKQLIQGPRFQYSSWQNVPSWNRVYM